MLSKPNKINRRTEKPSVGKTDGLKNRPSVNPHLLNTNTKINTKNIHFKIGPRFNYSPGSFYLNNYPAERRLYNVGITTGFNYW